MRVIAVILSVLNALAVGACIVGFLTIGDAFEQLSHEGFLAGLVPSGQMTIVILVVSLIWLAMAALIASLDKDDKLIYKYLTVTNVKEFSFWMRVMLITLVFYMVVAKITGFLVAALFFIIRLVIACLIFIFSGDRSLNGLRGAWGWGGAVAGVYDLILSITDIVIMWLIRLEMRILGVRMNS